MNQNYILDACALIAYLNDEIGAEVVEHLFDEAELGTATISMGKINLLEVYYGILRELGQRSADEVLDEIKSLPIQFVSEIEDNLFFEAARIKATYKLSLADALALGLAISAQGRMVTSDHHELDIVEKTEGIGFLWIR